MIEFFAELDQVLDEGAWLFDPRPWHADRPQRPKVWSRDNRAVAAGARRLRRIIISIGMSSAGLSCVRFSRGAYPRLKV